MSVFCANPMGDAIEAPAQARYGVDVAMVLDECPPWPVSGSLSALVNSGMNLPLAMMGPPRQVPSSV